MAKRRVSNSRVSEIRQRLGLSEEEAKVAAAMASGEPGDVRLEEETETTLRTVLNPSSLPDVVDLHLPGEHNQNSHAPKKLVKGVGVHTGAPKQGGKTNFLVKPGSGTVRAWRGTIKTADYKKEVAPGVAPEALVSGTINPKTGSVVAYAPAGMDPGVAEAAIKDALPGAKKVTVVPAKTQGKGSGKKNAPMPAPAPAATDPDKQAAVEKLGAVLKGVAQGETAANPFFAPEQE